MAASVLLQDILLALAAVVLVWFVLRILGTLYSSRSTIPMAPSPPIHWLYGNTAVFRSNVEQRHTRLQQLHQKYGKIVRIQMGRPPLYGRNIFSVADPHLCEEVLKSKSYAISKLTQARFKQMMGNYSLNTLEGEEWKRHRRLILPLFHSRFLSYALEVVSHKTQVVIEKWREAPEATPIEVFSCVKNLALDIMGQAAFGYDLKVQENPDDKLVKAVNAFLGHAADLAFLALPSLWKFTHPFKAYYFHQQRSIFDDLVQSIIQQRQSQGEEDDKNDLLTLLLRARDPESKYKLSDQEVHDEIIAFLFGGSETTTSQLCWALYHLALHPEIQSAAQEEVDRVVGNSVVVTSEMEKQLKYLTNCLKESMRLIPVITGFSRGAVEDTQLGGYHIPKGSVMFLDSYVLHHMTELWTNPEEFDPSRWDDKMAVRTFSFLPFGGGNRRCVGQPFATVEMKGVIALILKNFTLKLDESKPISTQVKIALGFREIHFFLSKRK